MSEQRAAALKFLAHRREEHAGVNRWDSEAVPLLKSVPGLRPVAIFDEIGRRHPEIGVGIRRTLERRIRAWRALNGAERDVIFRQENHFLTIVAGAEQLPELGRLAGTCSAGGSS
jgi:hypothetical protein